MEKNENTMLRHFPERKLTIAIKFLHGNNIVLASAMACDKDHWSREMGRNIALGRLNSKRNCRGKWEAFISTPSYTDKDGRINFDTILALFGAHFIDTLTKIGDFDAEGHFNRDLLFLETVREAYFNTYGTQPWRSH